mgnify:CR=1 FL=1
MAFEGSPGQRALHEAFPPEYHQVLFPPEPDPPFEDPGELAATWGQVWGASDEVGVLRTVLVRRPGDEFRLIRADAWDPAVGALIALPIWAVVYGPSGTQERPAPRLSNMIRVKCSASAGCTGSQPVVLPLNPAISSKGGPSPRIS